jgi:hypothetical protein
VDNLTIEMFSEGTDYDFEDFDCGEPSLNAFLTEHLVRQHNGRILRGYLLKDRDRPRVLGYYTLSGSCFERAMLPSKTQQPDPLYQRTQRDAGTSGVHKDYRETSGEQRSSRMHAGCLWHRRRWAYTEYLLMHSTSRQNDFI